MAMLMGVSGICVFILPFSCGCCLINKIYSCLTTSVRFASKFHLSEGNTLETVLNNIDLMAKEIKDTLTDFMLNHSRIEPRRPYVDEVCCLTPEGDRCYASLDDAGCKVQSSLKNSYNLFYSTFHPLLKDQSEDVLSKMSKFNEVCIRTIEHRICWSDNTKEALQSALVAFEGQLKLLKSISEEKSRKE